MSTEGKDELPLEIAHVLFVDLIGYSKWLINEQQNSSEELSKIVRETETFRAAEMAGKLHTLPTGDGMALAFFTTPIAPIECALEISRALRNRHDLPLRMGVHSGPVSVLVDVNDRTSVAGAGINLAQSVMNCGDAGHILVSKRVAEDLGQYRQWHDRLHNLGEHKAKHGQLVAVFNFYGEEFGNAEIPKVFRSWRKRRGIAKWPSDPAAERASKLTAFVGIAASLALIAAAFWFFSHPGSRAGSGFIGDKSIAVLPFENLSSEKENAYFTDGVQDEILTDLSRIADLKVISRTSVMHYTGGQPRNLAEIGRELRVAHVLEGSVQRDHGKVRVNAQLIDVRTDAHLWAQTYDRDLADVFAIQSEIAKAIADQLQARLSPNEQRTLELAPTSDVKAFDFYSRAKTLYYSVNFSASGRQSLLQAVDLLGQAVARDPQFFQAYCQLAYTHDQLYFLGLDHTPERLALADAAMTTALRLQPRAGEAHLARAENLYRGHLDFEGALMELKEAAQTLPNDPRIFALKGYVQRRQGRHEEALHDLERSLELDPRNFFTLQQLGISYYMLRRYSEVATTLDKALAINPNDGETQFTRALVELDWKADNRRLHQTIEMARAQNPAALPAVAGIWMICALSERDAQSAEAALAALGQNTLGYDAVQFHRPFCEGLIARMMNDEERAHAAFALARVEQEKLVAEQPEYGPALCILGVIDAALGRKEDALREGRRAIELLPVAKDSINGARMIEYFAVTAAWVGEKELACEQLEIATQLPGYGLQTYGELKLSPFWDPLRGDARFEKLVATLAPKA